MRINYCFSKEDELEDYINFYPEERAKLIGDPIKISNILSIGFDAEDSECTEIRAKYVLDRFMFNDYDKILDYWISKLRLNGKITIIADDLFIVSKMIVNRQLNQESSNLILYNEKRQSIVDITHIISMLSEKGLKILEGKTENVTFCIKGQRVK